MRIFHPRFLVEHERFRCRVIRMPIAQEPLKQNGDDEEVGDETVLFDNLQSQDEDPASDDGEGLKGPLSFVLDGCPFGPGVMTVLKSMSKGEECEAWLDPKHGPGETTTVFALSKQKGCSYILNSWGVAGELMIPENAVVHPLHPTPPVFSP